MTAHGVHFCRCAGRGGGTCSYSTRHFPSCWVGRAWRAELVRCRAPLEQRHMDEGGSNGRLRLVLSGGCQLREGERVRSLVCRVRDCVTRRWAQLPRRRARVVVRWLVDEQGMMAQLHAGVQLMRVSCWLLLKIFRMFAGPCGTAPAGDGPQAAHCGDHTQKQAAVRALASGAATR